MNWRDGAVFVAAGWVLSAVMGVLAESLYVGLVAGFLGSLWFLFGALYGYDDAKQEYAGGRTDG